MRKNRILILLLLVLSLFVSVVSFNLNKVEAASSSYYSSIDSSTGTTLKSKLRTLITNTHTYKTTYDDCKDPAIVKKTDGDPNNSGNIILFWSELSISSTWDGGVSWNREHVWPQSQGWFETSGAGADLHHIRPVDKSVNSSHNNNPYGIVSGSYYCTTSTANGSVTIDAKCKNGYFEPSDSKKGDTARIIFYMLVRYSESDSYPITNVASSMDLLLEWNNSDPVDASETRRNEAVYSIQGNRNPFIDNSNYANLIWDPDNASAGGNTSGGTTEETTPVTDVKSALNAFSAESTKTSLMLSYDHDTYSYTSSGNYSYTFTEKTYTIANTKTLNGVKWDLETTLMKSSGTKYYGYNSTKGQQLGSAENPYEEVTWKTVDNIMDGVTKVTVQASGASGTDATISVYVGTSKMGTTKELTDTNKTFSFTSSAGLRGNVKIVIKQTSEKAIYIKGVTIKYAGATEESETYSLNSAALRFGSYISKDIYDFLNKSDTVWGVEYVKGTVTDWASTNYKTVVCTPAQVATPDADVIDSNGEYYQFALVVKGLNYSHLDTTISARVFVEYEGVRYYMTSTSQSLRSVAKAYLNSGTTSYSGILNHLSNY